MYDLNKIFVIHKTMSISFYIKKCEITHGTTQEMGRTYVLNSLEELRNDGRRLTMNRTEELAQFVYHGASSLVTLSRRGLLVWKNASR